jgi:hypothetical protein
MRQPLSALASRTTDGHALAALRAPIGSDQHVGAPGNVRGATANLKLTFHVDHSAGADHLTLLVNTNNGEALF